MNSNIEKCNSLAHIAASKDRWMQDIVLETRLENHHSLSSPYDEDETEYIHFIDNSYLKVCYTPGYRDRLLIVLDKVETPFFCN